MKGFYTHIDDNPTTNQLLQVMAKTLRRIGGDEATNLATEIEQWLKGREFATEEEFEYALNSYDTAIQLNPDNIGTRFERAKTQTEQGQYIEALTDFEAILEIISRATPTPTPANATSPTATNTHTPTATPTKSSSGNDPTPTLRSIETTLSPTPTPTVVIPMPKSPVQRFTSSQQIKVRVEEEIRNNPSLLMALSENPSLYTNLTQNILRFAIAISSPTPEPLVPRESLTISFDYKTRVKDIITDGNIRGANVTIEFAGQASLDGVTDSNGLARIFIDSSKVGKPGFLIVEAIGYKRYTQHIELIPDMLPDIVRLDQIAVSIGTPTVAPTRTHVPSPTVTPTPTPKSTPNAEVIAPEGFVLLRRGPADTYDIITTLPNGTRLDVLRWVMGKKEWLKVATTSESTGVIVGYVNTASDLIRVNVNLDEIPPIYEFGPKLFGPKQFENRGVEDIITFNWQDYGLLEQNQVYSVILVRDDLSDEDSCYHWQTKEVMVTIKPKDFGCTPGIYKWGVGIATKLPEGSEHEWRDDSEFDERNPFGLGIPHPDKPKARGG